MLTPLCPPPLLCQCWWQEKGAYRQAYSELRDVKVEVDGLQASLERARGRLQRDFQAWFAAMQRSAGSGCGSGMAQQQHVAQKPEQMGQTSVAKAGNVHEGRQEQHDWLIPAMSSSAALQQEVAASSTAALPSFSSWKTAPSFNFGQQKAQPGGTDSSPGATPRAHNPQRRQEVQQQDARRRSGPPRTQEWHAAQHEQNQQQSEAGMPSADPFDGVDPAVLAAARPLLTGNPEADADIVRFYQARHALLRDLH
jgi:kinesin family protein 6/9